MDFNYINNSSLFPHKKNSPAEYMTIIPGKACVGVLTNYMLASVNGNFINEKDLYIRSFIFNAHLKD